MLCKSFDTIYQKSAWRNNLYKQLAKLSTWNSKIHTEIKTILTSDDLLGEKYEEQFNDTIPIDTAILLI